MCFTHQSRGLKSWDAKMREDTHRDLVDIHLIFLRTRPLFTHEQCPAHIVMRAALILGSTGTRTFLM